MCFLPKMKIPDPPRPMLPRQAPRRVDESALAAKNKAGASEANLRGLRSMYRTGQKGLTAPAITAGKTLLGT